MFRKVTLQLAKNVYITVYTDMDCTEKDKVVVETKKGLVKAKVVSLDEPIDYDPFESGRAKCHIVENISKKITKENIIMFANQKTVEVQHVSSNRVGVFYTDLNLKVGDIVVYERGAGQQWSVGKVVNIDPDCLTADRWVIDLVDTAQAELRKATEKELKKLKAKLEYKKSQFQDIELLRLIASNDPETAELLEQYSRIAGAVQQPAKW